MKHRLRFPIENKILIPFVCISLITVACFCFILYYTEYHLKIETETVNAKALVGYINADINAGGYWTDLADLLDKYQDTYPGDSLFLYDQEGRLLFGRRTPGTASWYWRTAAKTAWAGGWCISWTSGPSRPPLLRNSGT